ncbi:MAG TPA: PAS domain S-box protein [Longimicrobium sp.]|jgi:PAS domain S-box-containing protein
MTADTLAFPTSALPEGAPPAPSPGQEWSARLLDALQQAVVVTDPAGVILAWNRHAEALYGWRAGEVLGRSVLEVTPAELSADEAARILERLARGESWSGDFLVRRRDGTAFYAHVTDTPMLDAEGRLVGIVGVSHDVTARKAAEEELRRSAEELADFFDNASMGLHWVAADGTILRANRTELEMLGYAPEEYVGHHIAEFHADPHVIDDILARLARGETLLDYEARMRGKDGTFRHVLINSNVLFRGGEFVHTRCLTRDVTDLLRLKDEAEAASRAKSDFLAVVSHELRTPLNAIIGYGELLVGEVVGRVNETQRHHLDRILASAALLRELIDQLLSLSRIEAGEETLRRDAVDVAALAAEVASVVQPLAARKGLALEVDVAPFPAPLCTDRSKLRQILLNLLSNAVKFTDHGSVTLAARCDGAGAAAVFEVRDTGPGIPPEHWETIFAPFTQLDQSRTRREGGTGLGLTVTRRYSALLGGDVTVASTVGRGTVFTVRLPLGA